MKRMGSSLRFALAALLIVSALPAAFAADSDAAPPPPSKEHVLLQGMVGSWVVAITYDLLNGTTGTGTGTSEIESCADGRGVVGTADFDLGELGKVNYGVMFGFDQATNLIHFYSVGTTGEVHDHMGSMHGANGFMSRWEGIKNGVQAAEDLMTTIEADKITFHEQDTADGKPAGTFHFEFTRR